MMAGWFFSIFPMHEGACHGYTTLLAMAVGGVRAVRMRSGNMAVGEPVFAVCAWLVVWAGWTRSAGNSV